MSCFHLLLQPSRWVHSVQVYVSAGEQAGAQNKASYYEYKLKVEGTFFK